MVDIAPLFPALDGSYLTARPGGMNQVWLGGEKPVALELSLCHWQAKRYHIEGCIALGRAAYPICAIGVARDETQLMAALLSSMASCVPSEMEGGVERDRLVDFVFDQLVSPDNPAWRRISNGFEGSPWITTSAREKAWKKRKGNITRYCGDLIQHPLISFILSHSTEAAVRASHADGRIMPIEMGEQMCHAPLLILDGNKPAKRICWPEFRHAGAIITGMRCGLEAWARDMAERHKRPLIVIKTTPDVNKVSPLIAFSTLICPLTRKDKTLGKMRSELAKNAQLPSESGA